MLTTVTFLALGLVLLFAGGEGLVRGSAALALRLRIPPFIIGVTIVGFGTSMPEMLVSINAALKGSPDIAIGNIVGSNIANILLILGISALLLPLKQDFSKVSRDMGVMVCAGLALVVLSLFGSVELWAGVIMVGSLASYLIYIVVTSQQNPDIEFPAPADTSNLVLEIAFVLIGLACLIVGADWLVNSSTTIARSFGISEAVIGLTIVAVGTSLPELATTVVAAIKRETDIAVGNILGSNIFNILGILGVTAIITPITISPEMARFDVPIMFAIFLSLSLIIFLYGRIQRPLGAAAVLGYIGYIAYLY